MKAALDAWGDCQNSFFLLLSKVTFRYRNRDRFLGSFMIGSRSSLPSAEVFSRKRSSPSCTTSIFVGFFAMGHKIRVSDGLDKNKKAPNLSGLVCSAGVHPPYAAEAFLLTPLRSPTLLSLVC
jgi:hypothetical protein